MGSSAVGRVVVSLVLEQSGDRNGIPDSYIYIYIYAFISMFLLHQLETSSIIANNKIVSTDSRVL